MVAGTLAQNMIFEHVAIPLGMARVSYLERWNKSVLYNSELDQTFPVSQLTLSLVASSSYWAPDALQFAWAGKSPWSEIWKVASAACAHQRFLCLDEDAWDKHTLDASFPPRHKYRELWSAPGNHGSLSLLKKCCLLLIFHSFHANLAVDARNHEYDTEKEAATTPMALRMSTVN